MLSRITLFSAGSSNNLLCYHLLLYLVQLQESKPVDILPVTVCGTGGRVVGGGFVGGAVEEMQ